MTVRETAGAQFDSPLQHQFSLDSLNEFYLLHRFIDKFIELPSLNVQLNFPWVLNKADFRLPLLELGGTRQHVNQVKLTSLKNALKLKTIACGWIVRCFRKENKTNYLK